MKVNGHGTVYSIDYPFRADESLDEFRAETFDEYGGAAIPQDKDPGWIIPDSVRDNWELIIGKSQRELPKLIADLNSIDFFAHDSEHSTPCMLFEFELAWEWLERDGILVTDDISWNDAFDTFTDARAQRSGLVAPNAGYAVKTE